MNESWDIRMSRFLFTTALAWLALGSMNVFGQIQSPIGIGGAISSRVLNRPTVSPYLSLLDPGAEAIGLPTYHTRVRPRLAAQRVAQEQRRDQEELRRLQTQVNRVRSDFARAQLGATGVFPTGHPTRFRNYGHYYPALNRQ